jgi:hypothetical protein
VIADGAPTRQNGDVFQVVREGQAHGVGLAVASGDRENEMLPAARAAALLSKNGDRLEGRLSTASRGKGIYYFSNGDHEGDIQTGRSGPRRLLLRTG